MIMVTGVHGQLGSSIFAKLKEQNTPVIGASRTPVDGIRQLDFDQPDTIDFTDITTLVLVSAGYAEDDQVIARHRAVVNAAQDAGVKHIIYTSLVASGDHLGFALAHRATETLIANSGLRWTFLRNGLYAELFGSLMMWTPEGTLESAFGDGSLAAVARADLAVAAAIVATSPSDHEQKIYELTGVPLTASHVADALGVDHHTISLSEYRERLSSTDGLLPFQAPMLTSIASSVRQGVLSTTGTDLQTLLGRPPVNPLSVAADSAAKTRND